MEVKQFVLKLSRVLCLVLPELVTYLVAYYAVNIAYRSIGPEYNDEEGILTRLVAYFNTNGQNLARDLTFLLGFYVATVAKRWWAQSVLPVPDNLVLFLSGVVLQGPTQDHQRNLHLKRTVIRQALVTWILFFARFNPGLKGRFPDMAALRHAGLLTDEEMTKLNHHSSIMEDSQLWTVPLNWAANLVRRAKSEGAIGGDAKEIWRALARYQDNHQRIEDYQSCPLPYVYKTVVVTAVYVFLVINVLAEQDIGLTHLDLFFPLFGCFKVIFFVGWLKAALAMENPLRSSDLSAKLNRHMSVCQVLLHDDENADAMQ